MELIQCWAGYKHRFVRIFSSIPHQCGITNKDDRKHLIPEMNSPLLRHLPAIDEILLQDRIADALVSVPREQVVQWAREEVDLLRQRVLVGEELQVEGLMSLVVEQVIGRLSQDYSARMQTVLNATGILLHTNLGRAPLAEAAVAHVQAAAGCTNLEMDLGSGKRSIRGARVRELLAKLTGAEDAIIVNNCAAATILTLQAIAAGREVIVSRGQLVEIGGGFRLPEVFESAGVRLREVGTTNRTYLRDYENAVGEETGAIIRVHRSNFQQSGFVTEPAIDEMALAQRPKDVPVIDDLGSGHVVDLSERELPEIIRNEPRVQQSVSAGADLCLFSGDKLFGGPQCGVIVGKKKWVSKLAQHPMMRALRADKLILAAMEATTEIHLAGKSAEQVPFFQMLLQPVEAIRNRCEQVLESLRSNLSSDIRLSIESCFSQVGGGSMPGAEIPSFALSVRSESSNYSVETMASRLRAGTPAVHARISEDSMLLDLRTIQPRQTAALLEALAKWGEEMP